MQEHDAIGKVLFNRLHTITSRLHYMIFTHTHTHTHNHTTTHTTHHTHTHTTHPPHTHTPHTHPHPPTPTHARTHAHTHTHLFVHLRGIYLCLQYLCVPYENFVFKCYALAMQKKWSCH